MMGFNKGGAVMSKAAIQSLCWECESLFDCPKKDNKLPNFAEYVSAENTMCNSGEGRFKTLERTIKCKYHNKPIPPSEQNNYTEPNIREGRTWYYNQQAVEISLNGEPIKQFKCITHAANYLKLANSTINRCIALNKATKKGYSFRFIDGVNKEGEN